MNDPVTQPETAKGWSPRTLRLALLASMAVNLLGIGIIAGAILRGPPHHARGEFGLKSFSYTLPQDRGQVMRTEFQTYKPAVMELRKAARAARSEAIAVLAAEPYDPAKLGAALQRLNDAEAKSRERVSEYFLATAGKLTPEERVALSQWWRKRQASRHHSRDDQDKPTSDAAVEPANK